MKWLVALLVVAVVVYGFRWLDRRLQRKLQPRRPAGPPPVERRAAPAPVAPAQPPAKAAEPTSTASSTDAGFGLGLSAVADDGPAIEASPLPLLQPDDDVGSYTMDDWGLKTVRQEAAAPEPEPEPEPEPPAQLAAPADAPLLTVEFGGAPTALLDQLQGRLEAGEVPDAAEVEVLAENPLTRAAVYRLLKPARKLSLIPRKLRTQKSMAEADLIVWLTDSRLGRPPQAIEQVSVHSQDTDDGRMDWYLFRFKSGRRSFVSRGWMAGVSGPWVRSEGPGGAARGDTGSDFEPWEDHTDEEHARSVQELVEAWSSRG